MKYSFVLPAYKATYFREAIDSILAQTYTDFELIIVNDASPEDLDSIVKSYDDSRIKYFINEDNIGGKDLVAQWNHSILYARGEYLILASDDDVYFPQYLERMDVLVEKYPDVKVFRPRVQVIDEQGRLKHVYGCISEKVSLFEYCNYWISTGGAIGHIVFDRESLIEKGGFVNFPMAWGSDEATILMMGYRGICFDSEILYSFRNSGVNISSRINNYHSLTQKVEARRQFYNWLKGFLEENSANSIYEQFHKEKSQEQLANEFQSITLSLLNQTTFLYALRVVPRLLKLEYVSFLVVLKKLVLNLFSR